MAHIRDVWMKVGPNGRRVRSPDYGHGKRWELRWIDQDGRERSKRYATQDVAKERKAELELGVAGPRYSTLTVAEYAETWLSHQLHYSDNSRSTARHRLNGQIIPALGDRLLTEVTRLEVQTQITRWSEDLEPNTVRLVASFLRNIFRTAAEDHLIPISPCVRLNLPPRGRRKIIPLTAEQVGQIAAKVSRRYRGMVILAASSGMRPAEVAGLTADRVVAGDVVIDRQLIGVLSGGAPVFGPPKSESSDRRVAIGRLAQAALAEHMEDFPPGREGLLFTTREQGALRRTRLAEIWHRGTDGMGLRPRTGWHEFRHYHASVLIHAGRSPKAVADRMGHADAAETLRTYAHLWPSDEADLVSILDADLAPYIPVAGFTDSGFRRARPRISPSGTGADWSMVESKDSVRSLVSA